VFTTIDGVLAWIEEKTGLDFSDPIAFISSLMEKILDTLDNTLGLVADGLINFLNNITTFFNGLPNIFGGSFNLPDAIQYFLTETLGIAEIGAAGLQFVESLIPNTVAALTDFFANLTAFLGLDLRQFASGDFNLAGAVFVFLDNIKEFLLYWINFYVFGGVNSVGQFLEERIFNPIVQQFLSGLKLPLELLGITDIAEAGLGTLADLAGTLLTSLTAVPADILEGLLPPGLLGQIPVSNIADVSPNLINLGSFAESVNIEAANGWSWDASNNFPGSSGGSAKLVIDQAGDRHLYSRQAIPVTVGDRLVLSAEVITAGLAVNPTGSTPITISLIPFAGTVQQAVVPIGTRRGDVPIWAGVGNAIEDPYVVTDESWTSVIVRLTVESTATAGIVWWDEVSLTKTGKLEQDNVDSLIDAWNSMIGGLTGLPAPGSGYDWTSLFSAAQDARQQGTTAQSRLETTNTNLFGNPLGGTTIRDTAVPSLTTDKITSGTFNDARIPTIQSSKLADFAVSTNKLANSAVTGIKTSALDASKITTGTLGDGQVPTIQGSKLADLAVSTNKLANSAVTGIKTSGLDASKITTGTLSEAQLPSNVGVVGSGIAVQKTTSTYASAEYNPNGEVPLYTFYNSRGANTSDLTAFSTSTSRMAVKTTYAGWYMLEVSFRLKVSNETANPIPAGYWNFDWDFALGFQTGPVSGTTVTPLIVRFGSTFQYSQEFIYTGQVRLHHTFVQYVYAGWAMQPLYLYGRSNTPSPISLISEAYFSVSLLNRSLA